MYSKQIEKMKNKCSDEEDHRGTQQCLKYFTAYFDANVVFSPRILGSKTFSKYFGTEAVFVCSTAFQNTNVIKIPFFP